jgi:hypothetical protein
MAIVSVALLHHFHQCCVAELSMNALCVHDSFILYMCVRLMAVELVLKPKGKAVIHILLQCFLLV